MTTLSNAMDILDKNLVKQVKATPSGRVFYMVAGSRKDHPHAVFANSFCSCPSFLHSVVNKKETIFCKHSLAVQFAHAMGKYTVEEVTDVEFAQRMLFKWS